MRSIGIYVLTVAAVLAGGPLQAQQKPRDLSDADLHKLRNSVQRSKSQNAEDIQRERARARQEAEAAQQQFEALVAADQQRQAEEAQAEAENAAENARRSAAADAAKRRLERDLDESIERFHESTARREAVTRQLNEDAGRPKDDTNDGQATQSAAAGVQATAREAEAASMPATDARIAHAASSGPLRFVLSIGLAPKPGDTVNPTCYSNVITRPGPPGWGQGGFLPSESSERARATVENLKSSFIQACRRASGRDVTSEGNFHWTWNEFQDGDSQIANTRAQYPEDVTVAL